MTGPAHGGDVIYLDHNATTPIAPEVAAAMWPYLTTHFGNPSSDHPFGRAARAAVDTAREQVAALIGAHPDEIVFTSGGTESNNLAIRGTAATLSAGRRHVVTSTVEHPATVQPVRMLAEAGWDVTAVGVDRVGRIDPGAVAGDTPVGFGTFILAQNEVGTLQPIAELADALHARGAVVHTDAAQAVGKIPVNVDALGVDLLSIAGHKCYAPKGVGALYVRRGTPIGPVLVGAGQEHGVRPGTENVASIVGLGTACALAGANLATESQWIGSLRDYLWELLSSRIPQAVRLGDPAHALPNTLSIAIPGRRGLDVLAACPNLAASTGSACHTGEINPSAVLIAMGVPTDVAAGAIRLSLGRHTTTEQIVTAALALSGGQGCSHPTR
jgi:cysteine desulfurase